jgi:hypothetical protein
MIRKGRKDKVNKAGHTDFGANIKDFGKMFEKMSKCCMGQDSPVACCAMMDERMKEMMRKCCVPGPGEHKANSSEHKA